MKLEFSVHVLLDVSPRLANLVEKFAIDVSKLTALSENVRAKTEELSGVLKEQETKS